MDKIKYKLKRIIINANQVPVSRIIFDVLEDISALPRGLEISGKMNHISSPDISIGVS